MNERTHFFYKNMYLSHILLDVSVMRERWVETGTDCYNDPTSSLNRSRILAGVAQPGVAEGQSPLSASWPSLWPYCPQLTQLLPASANILS